MGQCVGPDICCGPFGCLMGTSDAKDCQKENDTPVPCTVSGEPCGSRGQGNCVADGICCDSVVCSMNPKCETSSSKDLLVLIDRLLESKGLDD
ncbi:hypothetical protein ScPMuIL_000745 [Solemya velum]